MGDNWDDDWQDVDSKPQKQVGSRLIHDPYVCLLHDPYVSVGLIHDLYVSVSLIHDPYVSVRMCLM